jgi:hypothetical protein
MKRRIVKNNERNLINLFDLLPTEIIELIILNIEYPYTYTLQCTLPLSGKAKNILICNKKIFNIIRKIYYNIFNTKHLINYKFFINLFPSKIKEIKLDFNFNDDITDKYLIKLNNLNKLSLQYNEVISYDSIKLLTTLTDINLDNNKNITDKTIKNLLNLKKISLGDNEIITDNGIRYLTLLEELLLYSNKKITNNGIRHLINLKKLSLCCTSSLMSISDKSLFHLTNLENLDLSYCSLYKITDHSLKRLTKLKTLNLESNKSEYITDNSISLLINLTYLNISNSYCSKRITINSIKLLTNLENLNISNLHDDIFKRTEKINKKIEIFSKLTNIKNLIITHEIIRESSNYV